MSHYPDSADIKAIEQWNPGPEWSGSESWLPILTLMEEAWNHDMGRVIWNDARTECTFITGGWSGNEEILGAMSDNFAARSMLWLSSHRGGKEVYGVGLT